MKKKIVIHSIESIFSDVKMNQYYLSISPSDSLFGKLRRIDVDVHASFGNYLSTRKISESVIETNKLKSQY